MQLRPEDLDRSRRAVLGREWMLHGHLQDRVGMALLLEVTDRVTMQDVAIEEWRAASPVYTRRAQRALGFSGTDVATIFKGLQLDIGAPHQFLDFRFTVHDADRGEFFLAHCGALADVEPMGEEFVHGMCHAIEDPTFDATAGATNPRAQVRPLHRPPRLPADRVPHCAWRVDVVAEGAPAVPSALELLVASSQAAQLPVTRYPDDGQGGRADYSGAFDADLCLEDLSGAAQLVALDEFALQSHLLLRALLLAVRERFGEDQAASMLPRLVRGWSGLTAQRLRAAFDLPGTAAGVASLLGLHPMLAPVAYTGARVELEDDRFVRLSFDPHAPAAADADGATWWGMPGLAEVLEAVVQAAVPEARAVADGPSAFVVEVDPAAEPARVASEVHIARISTGATFRFGAGRARTLPPLDLRTSV
jgi:hypothetical protein